MKLACVGCCHAKLDFEVEKCDILLMAGDMLPAYHSSMLSVEMQANWLNTELRYWIDNQFCKEVLMISGNHDWIFEYAPDRVPNMNSNFHYLQDSGIELMGLKIWGSPWTPPFNDWAFNARKEIIKNYWEIIPEDTDVLLLHGPPYKIFDKVERDDYVKHIGSKSLLKRIKEIKPKFVVFAHNHGQHGIEEQDGITYVNCSLVDDAYQLVRNPIYLETNDD